MADIDKYGNAIASIESGGRYDILGPVTRKGDRAYGKYQIMGANVGPWTQEALGRAYTPDEFRNDPKAQEAVFKHKFGDYVSKFGPQGAAQAWFAGPGGRNNLNAKDQLGTTVASYGQRFNNHVGSAMGYAPEQEEAQKSLVSQAMAPQQQQMAQVQQIMQGNEPPPMRYGLGRAMVGAGSAIAGISSPAQAAALARLQEGMEDGSPQYATHFDPYTGTMIRINKKTGEMVSAPATNASKAAAAATKVAAPPVMKAQDLKFINEKVDGLGLLHDVNTLAEQVRQDIDSGRLDLGLVNNPKAKLQNYLGISTEQSQAFARWEQFKMGLSNDTLRLNKGVQTEGDAVRAMQEVVAGGAGFDNKTARQALNKVIAKNKQALDRGTATLGSYTSKFKNDDGLAPLVQAHGDRLKWYEGKNFDNTDNEEISAAKPGAGGGYKVLKVHPQR